MTGSAPTFSVVIPVYNGERYIQAAIESCLRQTVLPEEIIVIDDASTDTTADVVAQINSDLVVYKKNEVNQGPAFCRNRGMQMALGSWVVFLDADDSFHANKIEVIRFCLLQNEQIRAIGHGFLFPGKPVYQLEKSWQQKVHPVKLTTGNILLRNRIVTPALAVVTDNRVSFHEHMKYAEDHDFILRTAEKYGMWYLNMPLCTLGRIPLTKGGITNDRWEMRKGEMMMYLDYCKRNQMEMATPFFILFSLLKHLKNLLFYRSH